MVLRSDHVLPHWFSLRLPITGSQHIATLLFTGLSLLLYVTSGMSLLTVSYVFSVAFLFQLFLVSHIVCHRIIFDSGAVRGILSSSQAEPSQLVPPTALGNVHTPDGICGNHRNMGGQHRARVRGCPLFTSHLAYPACIHSPISLGVFAASFAVVFIGLFVTSAQPTMLRLALQFYSVSPLVRWKVTREWQGRLVSWYKLRRAARVCVWIKNDDVRLYFECQQLFCSTV